MPRLTPFERAALEEEILGHLAAGTWSLAEARRLARTHGLGERSVYEARARVVGRMKDLRASDLEGERALALVQLDNLVAMAGKDGKYSAAVSAIRLKLTAMGLLDRPPGEATGIGAARTTEELLGVIEEARTLSDRLSAPVVDEDEDGDDEEEEGDE